MVDPKDWRLQGQEKYLKNVVLTLSKYTKYRNDWDHDHCEFCFAKFMENVEANTLQEGYTTEDRYRWICPACFEDFKAMFGWKLR